MTLCRRVAAIMTLTLKISESTSIVHRSLSATSPDLKKSERIGDCEQFSVVMDGSDHDKSNI